MSTIWLTGLSGAGKTTIANYMKRKYLITALIVDGDDLRKGINADLGYSLEDRNKNVERAAHIAKTINDNGFCSIAAIMSPTEEQRDLAMNIIGEEDFFLVYVSCDLETLRERDTKGLYKKYALGEIKNMVGEDIAYGVPKHPDVVVNTKYFDIETCAEIIYKSFIKKVQKKLIDGSINSLQPQVNK